MTEQEHTAGTAAPDKQPYYARGLRLQHLRPSSLLCFLLFEGALFVAAVLALAGVVSWWAVLVLPLVVAVVVKLNDLVAGRLPTPDDQQVDPQEEMSSAEHVEFLRTLSDDDRSAEDGTVRSDHPGRPGADAAAGQAGRVARGSGGSELAARRGRRVAGQRRRGPGQDDSEHRADAG